MKFALCTLCLAATLAIVLADSDTGHFIPKAFYTLDSDGHKSELHPVNPNTAHFLRRLRRQIHSVSSSSSSSSVSGSDGIVHFTSQTVNSQIPDVGIASRFGGDSDAGTIGHVVHTVGVIDKSGKIYYKTHRSHF